MKQPFRSNLLPIFPAAAGILGLCLRLWLFSMIDEKGLLPAKHFADAALYILAAITLAVLYLAARELTPRRIGKQFYHLSGILGCLLGGIGMILTGIGQFPAGSARLSGVAAIAGIVGGIVLLGMTVLKFFRKRVSYGFYVVFTVCMMIDTVAQCQTWGSASQLQEYFFPLMASIFLILSAYHTTFLAAGQGKPHLLVFFSQGALFFCCVCLNTPRWPLYLGMLFWAAAQLYPHIRKRKEA